MVTISPITSVPPAVRFGLSLLPLAPLAWAVDRVIQSIAKRHPRLFQRLGPHTNKRFRIEPTDLPFVFALEPHPDAPRLTVHRARSRWPHQARIAGPLAALLGLLHGAYDGDALFFSRDIVIEGDVEAVLALRNALDDAELDLASEASAVLGPLSSPVESLLRGVSPAVSRVTGLAITRARDGAT